MEASASSGTTNTAVATPAHGRRWRRLVALALVADLGLVVANALWYADYLRREGPPFPPDAATLAWIQLTAIILGLIVATPAFAVIWHLGRRAEVPPGAAVLAGSLGMLGFLLAVRINDAIVVAGLVAPSGSAGFDAFGLVVAPAVEEPAKLVALLVMAALLRPRFGMRQGIVAGLLVGIGATLVETGAYIQTQYVGGAGAAYGTFIAVRFGLFGLGLHATTAALTGAGLGYALSTAPAGRRVAVLLLALAGAVATHAAWNLWASRLTLELVAAISPQPDFGSPEPYAHHVVWLASSVVTAVLVAPAALALAYAWRRARPDEPLADPGTGGTPRFADPPVGPT